MMRASGMPIMDTACAAATVTCSICGAAIPTSSEAAIIMRRAMNRGSSPGAQHPCQVVHGGVRVGSTHGFDECGNHIVMVVAVFVIAHGGHVHDLRYHVGSDDWPFRTFLRALSPVSAPAAASRIVSVFRASPPAIRTISSTASSFDFDFVFKSTLAFDGPVDERFQVVGFQRFEFDDHGSA